MDPVNNIEENRIIPPLYKKRQVVWLEAVEGPVQIMNIGKWEHTYRYQICDTGSTLWYAEDDLRELNFEERGLYRA